LDYKDFLRQRGLRLWDKDDVRALRIREIGRRKDRSYKSYLPYFSSESGEVTANAIICVIHQTNYLLDQQIRRLEELFIKEGGIREKMLKARLDERNKKR